MRKPAQISPSQVHAEPVFIFSFSEGISTTIYQLSVRRRTNQSIDSIVFPNSASAVAYTAAVVYAAVRAAAVRAACWLRRGGGRGSILGSRAPIF